ncbi:MAG: CHAT domain-containing protein [Caldilineaceae bacterium]|nr:CHAT domain-containing protein [Caldilineaceae bacterium]
MEPVYYNFDLTIGETDDGYLITLVNGPQGKISTRFVSPLSEQDLDHIWGAVERRREMELSQQRRIAREVGQRLFHSLIPEELSVAYRHMTRLAQQAQAALCLRLDLTQTPDLRYLPWEFLFDDETAAFLTLSGRTPFMRHLDLMHRIGAIPVQPPLRVLVVVAEPDTYAPFEGRQQWLNLVDSVGPLVHDRHLLLERLAKPSLFELQRRLRNEPYHVLHFIGHGVDNPLSDDGQLVFEDQIQRGRTVSGMHLGTLLRDHYPLRLTILQSCDNFADGIRRNPFAQAAYNMVLRQTPAAIAVPQALEQIESAAFFSSLYHGLAGYQPIAGAVADARKALATVEGGIAWGLPLLYSRTPSGLIFDNGALLQPTATVAPREPSLWERVMQLGRNRPG